jgi:Transposase DDE domain group 1
VNATIRRRLANRKRRIARRLDKTDVRGADRPMFTAANIRYEVAERSRGLAHGGVGVFAALVRRLELADAIDRHLRLLKIHLPFHESDHVLNFAYNALCEGTCLQDIELRRNDEVFLDALATRRIPDPTTAGDFCRRFQVQDIRSLQDAFHETRLKVWTLQPDAFRTQATIDMDGTLVATTGQCKQGMDIAYNGTWGYHPLVLTLAQTGEVLSIVNRSGNRPSHEGAAAEVDRCLEVCFQGGFRQVLLRGDTDFTQTRELDRWDDDVRVQFIFGTNVTANLHLLADDLPAEAWQPLLRPPRCRVPAESRQRPEKVKEQIVVERQFQKIRLVSEAVAESEYRPTVCRKSYRLIVVRKNLSVEKGESVLFEDYRYFFYLTNDRSHTAADVVLLANERCNQENLHAQLKNGVCALRAPVDNLESNWAYMVMTALAWNLKAWWALLLPEGAGRWQQQHQSEKRWVLGLEFRTFVQAFVRLPCQLLRTGRRLVYRLLSWNPHQGILFRLLGRLRC